MATRRRRSPQNRNDIADFVRQRVRDALDADRADVNVAGRRNTTAVRSTQFAEVLDRRARERRVRAR